MMKNHTILNLLFFTCFLVIGNFISTRIYHSRSASESETTSWITIRDAKPIQSLDNGQQSILLIGVDSLESSKPQLESVWLVSYLPSDSTLHILPIFPSGRSILSDFEIELQRNFGIVEEHTAALSKNFIDNLEDNNYWWSGLIIFDHAALSEMTVDSGVENNSLHHVSMKQAIEAITEVNEHPELAFNAQVAILQSACHKLSGLSQPYDWSQVISLIPDHITTDLVLNPFIREWNLKLSSLQNPNCIYPPTITSEIDK